MGRRPDRWLALLCGAIALLAGVVAAVGVLDRGDGSVATVVNIRGVAFDMTTTGVYAYNAERVVAEGVGWDVFTLMVAAPALLLATPFVAAGSFRGRLFALGVLGCLLYQYLEYAVGWAFGPLFLAFVVLHGASLLAMAGVAALVARDGVAGRFTDGFPRRAWVALGVTMSLLLTFLWLGRIRVALDGDLAAAGLTSMTTLTVQALDLGLVVPVLLLSAWLAWRRTDVGYALVAVLGVAFVGMAGAIVGMLLSAAMVDGYLEIVPLAIFGGAALLGAVIVVRAYRAMTPAPSAHGRGAAYRAAAPHPVPH